MYLIKKYKIETLEHFSEKHFETILLDLLLE